MLEGVAKMNRFNIELKITERDKKIIKYFGLFLIVVGFSYLIIKPCLDNAIEYSDKKTELEFELAEMENMVDNKINFQTQVNNYTKLLETKAADFYDRMTNQEIDNMITTLFQSYGLDAKDLTISVDEKKAIVANYVQSEKNKDSKTPVAQEFSNIYVSDISVKSTGSKENFRKLLDHIYNEMPGVLIENYSIVTETSSKNNITSLNLSINIFMVAKR